MDLSWEETVELLTFPVSFHGLCHKVGIMKFGLKPAAKT